MLTATGVRWSNAGNLSVPTADTLSDLAYIKPGAPGFYTVGLLSGTKSPQRSIENTSSFVISLPNIAPGSESIWLSDDNGDNVSELFVFGRSAGYRISLPTLTVQPLQFSTQQGLGNASADLLWTLRDVFHFGMRILYSQHPVGK